MEVMVFTACVRTAEQVLLIDTPFMVPLIEPVRVPDLAAPIVVPRLATVSHP